MQTVFFTIAARNYLAQVLTLFESLARTHPGCPRYLCLVDDDADLAVHTAARFETITIDRLELPDFDAYTFRYTLLELSTAVKPSMFRWLQQRHPDAALIYLDPDVLVLDRLVEAERVLRDGASVVLTPHLLEPIDDQHQPDELAILRSGAYNAGFVALRADHTAITSMLAWWCDRLEYDCVVDPASGRFTDQRWLDLLPGLFADVAILRDAGYNVAYWNLAQRPVSLRDGRWHAGDSRLAFVHFSGIDPRRPQQFSRHQNRMDADGIGALRPIYDDYLSRLAEHGHAEHVGQPHRWDRFDDGERISPAHRRVYREHHDLRGPNPVERPRSMDRSLFDLSSEMLGVREALPVSRLMHAVWSSRDDLQRAFDLGDSDGRAAYVRWFLRLAASEYGIAERHIEPIRRGYQSGLAKRRAGQRRLELPGAARRWFGAGGIRFIERSVRLPAFRFVYALIPTGLKQIILQWLERMSYARSAPVPTVDVAMATAVDMKPTPSSTRAGINLIGYARGAFGVGEMLRTIAAAMDHGAVPFSVCDFPTSAAPPQRDPRVERHLSTRRPYLTNLFVINADQMAAAHEYFGRAAYADHYNIANWAWELERFPRRWDSAFELVDEFWVISDFVASALRARTNKPVIVVPPAITIDARQCRDRHRFGFPAERFEFLTSFDFNSHVTRKNPHAAIAAFQLAFPASRNDVGLMVKTSNGDRHVDALRALNDAAAADPRIVVRDELFDRETMWDLQAACDAYVSLHRSEGFGLGMAESMALAKPVVATAYSGNLDFMRADNSCLVDCRLVTLREGDYPAWRNQHWAEPSIEHAAEHLRKLADDPVAARLLGERARQSMAVSHSRDAMLGVVRARLAQIHAGITCAIPNSREAVSAPSR